MLNLSGLIGKEVRPNRRVANKDHRLALVGLIGLVVLLYILLGLWVSSAKAQQPQLLPDQLRDGWPMMPGNLNQQEYRLPGQPGNQHIWTPQQREPNQRGMTYDEQRRSDMAWEELRRSNEEGPAAYCLRMYGRTPC